jgi:AraC-like DNA-binding protein
MLKTFYEATGIPAFLCTDKGTLMQSSGESCFPAMNQYAIGLVQDSRPIIQALPSNIWIAVVPLKNDTRLILGPASTRPLGRYDFYIDLAPFPFACELESIFDFIRDDKPVSIKTLISAAIVAVRLCTGDTVERTSFQIIEKPIFEDIHKESLISSSVDDHEENPRHLPEKFYHDIYHYVREGNFEGFLDLFKTAHTGLKGVFSNYPERDRKYHFIFSAAIAHHAAISGGLPFETSCSITEYFCKKMDEMPHTNHLERLNAEMFQIFCESVHENRVRKKYSPVVSECISYIHYHIHEKINLENMARQANISSKWLSKKFREETGMDVVRYIHSKKILEAKHLLKHTTYNVAQISNILGYGSESYFIRIFCDFCGMTPLNYQKSL